MMLNLFVFFVLIGKTALEFFRAYLMAKSQSIDNVFVIIMIFSYFSVAVSVSYQT